MDYFLGDHIAYNVMVKPVGARCNLNCKYCYYLEKENLYRDSHISIMTDNVLENFIKQFIQSQSAPVVSFIWQGGEPMLAGLEFYRKAVDYQKYYAAGRKVINAFQTNGTLIDEKWCRFFRDHNFLVGVSVDGPEKFHDHYRPDKHGSGSWQRVMKGIRLLKDHNVDFNTLTVINDYNADHPIEVYEFLKSIGSRFHQYIPIVEQEASDGGNYPLSLVSPDYTGKTHITEWSVSPTQLGNFYISIFDRWVKNDVGSVFVQMFDVMLANWVNEPCGLCVYDKTCGTAAVLEHNGDLYSCDHFVYPENLLGNILDKPLLSMMLSDRQKKFGASKRAALPPTCLNCAFLEICNGGCPKNRVQAEPGSEKGLNYLCSGLKNLYTHVTPYMNFMAAELRNKRAPANVMKWSPDPDIT
jgi:uncharacterized protein